MQAADLSTDRVRVRVRGRGRVRVRVRGGVSSRAGSGPRCRTG